MKSSVTETILQAVNAYQSKVLSERIKRGLALKRQREIEKQSKK